MPRATPSSPLRDHVREHAENRPGVYRMYGPGGELLYVGKSIRIRTRLLSYFRAEPGEKPAELIRETTRIRWDHISDEFGALVREMRLIQTRRPKYNVQHKRKRAYAFVKITREAAPRVLPVTRVVDDGAIYYGPFPKVGRVGQTIRDLGHCLGLRDCAGPTPMHFADQLDIFGATDRTPLCMRADLGSCMGPCAGRVEARDYLRRVEEAQRFLENRSRTPLHRIREAMTEAAGRMDFEYAAIQRDRLERLRMFQDELTAFRGHIENLRFIYRAKGHGGRDRLYLIRAGRIRDHLAVPKSEATAAEAHARIAEAFGGPEIGPGALTAHEAAEILLVARYFRLNEDQLTRTFEPERVLSQLGRAIPADPATVFAVSEAAPLSPSASSPTSSESGRTPPSSPAEPKAVSC